MTRREKPASSRWLIDQRKRRGWTPADVASRVDAAETTVRGWESGRNIGADALIRLEAVFGVPAPTTSAAVTGDLGPVAAALLQQVEAINALVAEMRLARAEQKAWNRGVERALTELAGLHSDEERTGDPSSPPRADARP